MWKKSDDFSREDLEKLLSSPQAQALANMLQQMDPALMEQAARLAAEGNPQAAKQVLSPVLNDPKLRDLMKKTEEGHG